MAHHGRVTRDRHGRVDLGTCRASFASLGSCVRLFRGSRPAKAGPTGRPPVRVSLRWSTAGAAGSSLRQAGATGDRHSALQAAREDGIGRCRGSVAPCSSRCGPIGFLGSAPRRAWQSRAAMAFRFPHCEPAAGSRREQNLQPRAKRGGGRSAGRSRSWGKSSRRDVASRIFRPILMTWLMARGQHHGSPVAREPSLSAARDGMNVDLKVGQLCAFPARVREDRHLAPVGRWWFAVPSAVLANDWLQLSCSTPSPGLSAGAGV